MALEARGQRGSMVLLAQEGCRVHNVAGSGRMTLLQAREWRRGLGDGACLVDGIIGPSRGRWQCVKGLDHGQERRCRGSEEDLTMAWRRQRGLDDDTGSEEVDDGAGCREIFSGKF
jgi:hypothetical protein